MKPAPFRYAAPTTIEEAIELLGEHPEEAKLLAGGQSLVPLMNLRLADPSLVIDLNRVADLAYVHPLAEGVAVGAMTRHRDVAGSPVLAERCPIVTSAAALIGYPAIRNRGTIGGSLAHGDPVAEMPCVALATEAELVAVGPTGGRSIPASAFFVSLFTTALAPTEILTEVRFPSMRPGEGWSFVEFARKTGDFALAAIAVVLRVRDDSIVHARVALAGAGERPMRATAAEEALVGSPPDEGSLANAAAHAASSVTLDTGDAAEDRYRRHLIRTLSGRALTSAVRRAGGAT